MLFTLLQNHLAQFQRPESTSVTTSFPGISNPKITVDTYRVQAIITSIQKRTHSGKADSDGCSLSNMLEHFGFTIAGDVMGHFEVAKRSCEEREKI